LSATITKAENAPAAPGANTTEIVQLAPTARETAQLFVWEKSAGAVPSTAIPLMVSGADPRLLRVTACASPAIPTIPVKVRDVGARTATGAGAVPVPLRLTCCGDPVALSTIAIDAVKLPADPALKVTRIVQFASTANEAAQLFVSVKDPGFDPVTDIPVISSAAFPALLSVTDCALVASPTVPVKVSEGTETVATGAVTC
jgi:hypothetical protein